MYCYLILQEKIIDTDIFSWIDYINSHKVAVKYFRIFYRCTQLGLNSTHYKGYLTKIRQPLLV